MLALILTTLTYCGAPVAAPAAPTRPSAAVQSKKALRKELDQRLAKAGDNAGDVFAVAVWAERKGLRLDARRVLRRVIKLDKNHAEARKLLGFVMHDGKWIAAKDLARIEKRAAEAAKRKEAAEMRKKGFVLHEGSWIKKTDLAWAKLGLTKHDGKWTRVSDLDHLKKGDVQHPQTGTWIAKNDLGKANQGLFKVGDEWVPVDKANTLHASWDEPWVVQTDNCTIMTTMPFKKAEEIANEAETAVGYARGLIFDPTLPLPKRVVIRAFASTEAYREFGARADATGFSAYGCFVADQVEGKPIACNYGQKDWGPYYLKHAVGMGVACVFLEPHDFSGTHWLVTGLGSYVERWSNQKAAKHFGGQFIAKGGVRSLGSFFKNFKISGDQSSADMEWNIYQAGIILSYLAANPDKRTRQAWDQVRKAIRDGRKVDKAVAKFERAIKSSEKRLRNHLAKIMRS